VPWPAKATDQMEESSKSTSLGMGGQNSAVVLASPGVRAA
jgi:hypothetical protein